MTILFRLLLITVSVLTTVMVMRKIRCSKMQIEDSIFWVCFSILLICFSIFPQIVYYISSKLGLISPSNFIFLFVIFIMIVKIFFMSIRMSQMESRIKDLVQISALNEANIKENEMELHEHESK